MPLLEEGRQYANVIAEQRRIVNSQIRERLDEGGESDVGIVEPTRAERQEELVRSWRIVNSQIRERLEERPLP